MNRNALFLFALLLVIVLVVDAQFGGFGGGLGTAFRGLRRWRGGGYRPPYWRGGGGRGFGRGRRWGRRRGCSPPSDTSYFVNFKLRVIS
ncbi:hypothetical protein TYRP_000783 [Tyrophagus putrescentiae]|nr:hypothetical protein TYRP_000783 [Tyrophagus putrescentiae]